MDPDDPANRRIVDLDLAERNERGNLEFSTDFELHKPVDALTASDHPLVVADFVTPFVAPIGATAKRFQSRLVSRAAILSFRVSFSALSSRIDSISTGMISA